MAPSHITNFKVCTRINIFLNLKNGNISINNVGSGVLKYTKTRKTRYEINHTVVFLENFQKDYQKQLDMSGSSTTLSLNAELG